MPRGIPLGVSMRKLVVGKEGKGAGVNDASSFYNIMTKVLQSAAKDDRRWMTITTKQTTELKREIYKKMMKELSNFN